MAKPQIGRDDRVTVIGLGYFGSSLARTAHDLGYQVLAIDRSAQVVDAIANEVTLAVQGDGTNEAFLRSLQVDKSSVAVVAHGSNVEASVLSTLVLKKIGVPWVVAKALSDLHGEVLEKVGADRVVFPERDAGSNLAHALSVPSIENYLPLTDWSGVARITAPAFLVGRTVEQAMADRNLSAAILGILRGEVLIASPGSSEAIQQDDDLIVGGPDEEIEILVDPTARADRR